MRSINRGGLAHGAIIIAAGVLAFVLLLAAAATYDACAPRPAHAAAPPPAIGPLALPPQARPPAPPVAPRPARPPRPTEPERGHLPLLDARLPPTQAERRLVTLALERCELAQPRHLDLALALGLLRLEAESGVPPALRGLILAVGCGEVSYSTSPDARGDGGKARGWTQIHEGNGIHRWCNRPDLLDVTANARCWLARVVHIARTKARRCGKRRTWSAAEAWVAEGPCPTQIDGESDEEYERRRERECYDCKRESGHWARLMRWRRAL